MDSSLARIGLAVALFGVSACGDADPSPADAGSTMDGSIDAGTAIDAWVDTGPPCAVDTARTWGFVPPDPVPAVRQVVRSGIGILYALTGTSVFALNEETGALVWSQPHSIDLARTPRRIAVDAESRVYVADGWELHAYGTDGTSRWTVALGGESKSAAAYGADRIAVLVAADRIYLESYDTTTGTPLGSFPVDDLSEPLLAGTPSGRLALARSDRIISIDGLGETVLWSATFHARVVSDVAIAPDGHVAVAGVYLSPGSTSYYDGLVAVLDPTGAPGWSRTLRAQSFDYANGVAFGPDGSTWVTGHFGEGGDVPTTMLDYGGTSPLVSEAGDRDVFLIHYDRGGTPIRALSADGGGEEGGQAIAIGACGELVVGGFFRTQLTMGPVSLMAGADDPRVSVPFVASWIEP